MRNARILLVEDDASLRRVTEVQLAQQGYAVVAVEGGEPALAALEQACFDLVLTDLNMEGISGLELLRRVRACHPQVAVVLLTAFGTVQTAVEAMKAGAYHYLTKPVNADELQLTISRAVEHVRLVEEVTTLRGNLDSKYGFEAIIGRSPALLRVLEVAARAARSDATVLVQGETGTGKELLARALHQNSRRKDGPFVAINCGAIPRELLESELFGHVKGAFTGAVAHRVGRVETAHGGTLFLDEIGEMPLDLQVKLLRVIQEREVERVGGAGPTKVDVRLIAATHRNLAAMAEDGTFREDLYYRLSVIPLTLPPLRERPDDIPPLVTHLFARCRQRHGRPDLSLPDPLLPYFGAHRWPGNVRELENVLERIVVLAAGGEVTLGDLPEHLRRERPPVDALHLELPAHGISLEALERELLVRALRRFDGNQTQAAQYLDISRKTLIYRMEKHGIPRDRDEPPAAPGREPLPR